MISTRCELRKFPIPSHALFLWAKRLKGTLWSYNMFVSILYTIYDAMVFNFANCCNKMCITPFCNRNFFLHKNACKRMRLSAVFQKGNPITLATSIFHERDYIFFWIESQGIHVRIIKKVVGICEKLWYKLKYHGPGYQ